MTSGAPTTGWALFARLLRDRDGFVMVMVALLLSVLIGFAGLATETGLWYAIKRQNQSAADEAAISGAMEAVAGQTGNVTTLATRDAVRNGFVNTAPNTITVTYPYNDPSVPISNAVEVILSQQQDALFASLSLPNVTITTRAVATATSTGACAVSLAPTGQDGILASGSAVVSAPLCNLYDNSTDPKALEASGSAKIEVKNAYIRGNYNATLVTSPSCPGGSILCVPSPGVARTAATMPSPLDPYCGTQTAPACANRTTPTALTCPSSTSTSPTNDPTNPNFVSYNGSWQNNSVFYLATNAASAAVATTGNIHSNTTLDGLANTTGIAVGQTVTGNGIASGTTVAAISGSTVTLSRAADPDP